MFTNWAGEEEITIGHQYILEDFGMSIDWTAYKFSDKISVSGTFQEYTLNEKNSSGSIENILRGLHVAIPTESIITNNAIQDFKIKTYFFKVLKTPTITGIIIDASQGRGDILLKMNNMSFKNPYSYSLENDVIILTTHLDLKNWKAEEAMAVLNHQWSGDYKEDELLLNVWPEIDVTIKIPVNKILKINPTVLVYKRIDVLGKKAVGLNE